MIGSRPGLPFSGISDTLLVQHRGRMAVSGRKPRVRVMRLQETGAFSDPFVSPTRRRFLPSNSKGDLEELDFFEAELLTCFPIKLQHANKHVALQGRPTVLKSWKAGLGCGAAVPFDLARQQTKRNISVNGGI